ncbi:MAG TPA: hypothetical protein V6C90_28260 [Coleofasciculaceae cyanobacterium]
MYQVPPLESAPVSQAVPQKEEEEEQEEQEEEAHPWNSIPRFDAGGL